MDNLGSVTVVFKRGFKRGDDWVKTVEMREATADDSIIAQKRAGSTGEMEKMLFASLCECTPDELGSLSMADWAKLQKAYNGFFD